jgi:hypothetical protein
MYAIRLTTRIKSMCALMTGICRPKRAMWSRPSLRSAMTPRRMVMLRSWPCVGSGPLSRQPPAAPEPLWSALGIYLDPCPDT